MYEKSYQLDIGIVTMGFFPCKAKQNPLIIYRDLTLFEIYPGERGKRGFEPQTVISTKWTKWTHGEILSLHSCRREFEFAPTLYNPAELRGYGMG